jgi:putative MFS transporter
MAGQDVAEISAHLDRLPATRYIWRLVLLLSLGGCFEYYDLFFTAYIGPGLVRSGLFSSASAHFFGFSGLASFVSSTFAGPFLGTLVFGFMADKFGRRMIFTFSLLWYAAATVVLVTIDAYITELMPKSIRGRAFAINQAIQFTVVPRVALFSWLLVPLHPLEVSPVGAGLCRLVLWVLSSCGLFDAASRGILAASQNRGIICFRRLSP